MQTISEPITDLSQEITVPDKVSGPYYLAATLLLIEDPASASYFQQRFEELRQIIVRKRPSEAVPIVDAYGIIEGEWVIETD